MKVAHEIILNAAKGSVTIDGDRFPFYVMPDPEIELTASDVAGAPAVVHLAIIVENVRYISADGTERVLAQSDDETNRRWARRRAEEIVLLGLADTITWLEDCELNRQAHGG